MYWDPYGRSRRARRMAELERQRRLQEQAARERAEAEAQARAQAEQARRKQQKQVTTSELLSRFEQELAQARRERDEWADRYDQLLASLAEQREAIEAERQQLNAEREQWENEARASAEAQRERVLRNAEQRAFTENRKLLQRMLDVADNLDRALAQVDDEEQTPVAEGLRLTQREFQRALEQAGVERLQSTGNPFNPAWHEAVAAVPSEAEPGTVVEEVASGYTFRGALLRPAKVVVAQG